jgi:hypothetical protein
MICVLTSSGRTVVGKAKPFAARHARGSEWWVPPDGGSSGLLTLNRGVGRLCTPLRCLRSAQPRNTWIGWRRPDVRKR